MNTKGEYSRDGIGFPLEMRTIDFVPSAHGGENIKKERKERGSAGT